MKEEIKVGQRISWTYTHYLNGKSSFRNIKHGEYQGLIRHTKKYIGDQLAVVLFDGNKCQSKVPLYELKIIKDNE